MATPLAQRLAARTHTPGASPGPGSGNIWSRFRNEGLLGPEGVSQAEAAELEARLREASERSRALEWERDRLRVELGEFYARESRLDAAVKEAETEVRRREAHLEGLLQKATDSLNELQAELARKGAELEAAEARARDAGVTAKEGQKGTVRALEEKLRQEGLRAASLEMALEGKILSLEESQRLLNESKTLSDRRLASETELQKRVKELEEDLVLSRGALQDTAGGAQAEAAELRAQLREMEGALSVALAQAKRAEARIRVLKEQGPSIPHSTLVGDDTVGEEGGLAVEPEPQAPEPGIAEGTDTVEDLMALKVAELRKRLDVAGIAFPAKAKKADLVALLLSGGGGGEVDGRGDAAPQSSLEAEPVGAKRVARPSSADASKRAKRSRASTRKR